MDEVLERHMTKLEAGRLAELETIVERGMGTFVEVGVALAEIRDRRLYRETHATFEAYCAQRWGVSDSRGRQLIAAARTVTTVTAAGLPAPANERQARELVPLLDEPDALREAWSEASAGGAPTAEKVKAAVDRARPPASARPDWRTPILDALAADARAHRRTHATHAALEDALLAAFRAGHGERELRELLRQGGSEPTPRRLREWLDDAERREREGAADANETPSPRRRPRRAADERVADDWVALLEALLELNPEVDDERISKPDARKWIRKAEKAHEHLDRFIAELTPTATAQAVL